MSTLQEKIDAVKDHKKALIAKAQTVAASRKRADEAAAHAAEMANAARVAADAAKNLADVHQEHARIHAEDVTAHNNEADALSVEIAHAFRVEA